MNTSILAQKLSEAKATVELLDYMIQEEAVLSTKVFETRSDVVEYVIDNYGKKCEKTLVQKKSVHSGNAVCFICIDNMYCNFAAVFYRRKSVKDLESLNKFKISVNKSVLSHSMECTNNTYKHRTKDILLNSQKFLYQAKTTILIRKIKFPFQV